MLAGLRVADAFDPAPHVVGESAPLGQLLEHLGRSAYTDLPVVDEHRRLVGIIPLAELGRLANLPREQTAGLVASQVAIAAETVSPGDSLLDAIRRMGVRGAPSIPVVDRATGHLLGLVGRAHVLALYERAVAGGATGEHAVSFPPGRGPT